MLLNVGKQELQMIKTRCIVVDCVRICIVYIRERAPFFRPIYNHSIIALKNILPFPKPNMHN